MWTFNTTTGELTRDGAHVTNGYSGFGNGKLNPDMENVPDIGPIPMGRYTMELITGRDGEPMDYEGKKKPVLRLDPDPTNQMFGRAGFLIHGDSVSAPGTASHGCIIENHDFRQQIVDSGDTDLQVV